MDALLVVSLLVVGFVVFLIATAGKRKQALEEALKKLESERMKLKKSIEHVKLSFYQKKLGEKEAQDKIFEYEEELRDVEARIAEIKEKPLMRTLKKQEGEDERGEREAVEETEGLFMEHLDVKAIAGMFVFIVVALIAVAVIMNGSSTSSRGMSKIVIPVSAFTTPTKGTHPGGSAGLTVEIKNEGKEDLRGVLVTAEVPEGSGLEFMEMGTDVGEKIGTTAVREVPVLESGGSRDVFFPIAVDRNTMEGVYNIHVEVSDVSGRVEGYADSTLEVRIGRLES